MRKKTKRILKTLLLVFLIGLLTLVLLWHWNARRSIPVYSGEVTIPELKESVKINYNMYGMPHIWAENDEDLFFAIGFQHASERLFQMELIRRVSRGRLAEILGEDVIEIDLLLRKIGFERKALNEINDVPPRTKELLQFYVDGINKKIDLNTALPPEFLLLGIAPEKWELIDIGAIYLYQTWFSHALMNTENIEKEIMSKYGEELSEYMIEPLPWSPPTVYNNSQLGILGPELFPLRMNRASNAFTISAAQSETGNAILASDPHLQVNQLPGFWYALGMHSESGREAVGITTPGLPFVAMGHNGQIAWAFTVTAVDVIDYYAEKLDLGDSTRYLTPDGWAQMKEIKEEFKVKGLEQIKSESFYLTRHGIVMDHSDSIAIAMHWAGFDFQLKDILPYIIDMNLCSDFTSFRKHAVKTGALSANWMYADSSGNIGYQIGSPIPVRKYMNTFRVLPGDSSKYDWDGYWPIDKTPHAYNPPNGWIATCNNQPVADETDHYSIPGFYYPYRIIRATALLKQQTEYSVTDLQNMQLDLISPQVNRWKNLLADQALLAGDKSLSEALRNWNGNLEGDNKLASLFFLWWEAVPEVFFEDKIDTYPGHVGERTIEIILNVKNAAWVDNKKTERIETWEELIRQSFVLAFERWREKPWNELTSIDFQHLLGQSPIVNTLFNWGRGPYAYQGGPSTLNANYYYYDREEHQFPVFVAPSMRMVVNFADIDNSTLNLPAGQSGHPYNVHYADQIDIWRNGGRIRLPFSWQAVIEESVSELTLNP